MNDQSAAKLVTRSLSLQLSATEQAQLEDYLASSPQTRDFANLSEEIQRVLSADSEHHAEPGPGLSQLARLRIARNLNAALSQTDPSLNRRVAEDGQDYKTSEDQPE
jgi:hypothetical protein